ncbi:MAG: hypothetical protein AB7S69_14565 [Salinivirgaceae bacterium]
MVFTRFFLMVILALPTWFLTAKAQDNCPDPIRLQPLTGELFQSYFMQYRGNPFYGNDWFNGSVQLVSGEVYDHLKLRYDIYKDALHYYNPKLRRVVLLDKESVSAFWFEQAFPVSHKKVINLVSTDTTRISGFYFLLVNDSVSLYLKARKLIDTQTSSYPADGKLGVFYEKQECYFQKNQTISKLPLRKRNLLRQFPELSAALRPFIHKNRLKIKTPEHLIQIFEEINRLTAENEQ